MIANTYENQTTCHRKGHRVSAVHEIGDINSEPSFS